MAPSTVYTRASSSLTTSANPSVLRSLTSTGIRRSRAVPTRSLWWWGRHSTWSSGPEENAEERLQRHQKIMRHRYSRALRRRAMWDRDDAASTWLWRVPDARVDRKWGACRPILSTDSKSAGLDEKHGNLPDHEKLWNKTQKDFESFDKDFEAFKAAIDRAVQRDPYAAVFGRRLQSPPSDNNSSWISWLFNMGAAAAEPVTKVPTSSGARKIEIEVLDRKEPAKKSEEPQSSQSVSTPPMASVQSSSLSEYTYDPISGRRVPKSSLEPEPASQSKQSFLETLFSEHGVKQDKPVKQHRVFGHNPEMKKVSKASDAELPQAKQGFESSRLREYQRLRAATIGNHIDTTAQYGGRFENEPLLDEDESEKKVRVVPEPPTNAPLFSGTTYESKAHAITQTTESKPSPWLEKEGFRESGAATDVSRPVESSQAPKLQPAFERMQSSPPNNRDQSSPRLQPAVDRLRSKKERNSTLTAMNQPASPINEHVKTKVVTASPETDTREDVDLLRASDVRAAARVARITKQEMAQAKLEQRGQLEAKFDSLQEKPEARIPDAKQLRADSGRLSRSIDNVWQHAERYPDGVVARTMRSIGMIDEKFKDYQKPYQSGRTDLTQRLAFSEKSLQKLPSIYKAMTMQPSSKSSLVVRDHSHEQAARQNLTKHLRSLNKTAEEIRQREDAQFEQLAEGIRQVYESEHGPINLALAQNSPEAKDTKTALTSESDAKSPEDRANFSVERAKFLSEVDKLGKDVQSIKSKAIRLEKKKDDESITPSVFTSEVEKLSAEAYSCNQRADVISDAYDRSSRLQDAYLHPLKTATVKPGVPRYPIIDRHTMVFEPRYIALLSELKAARRNLQEMSSQIHDFKRSHLARDSKKSSTTQKLEQVLQMQKEQPESISKLATSTSPYIVLVYNKTTGDVDKNALNRLPWSPAEKTEKANPIKIMGNLNYPAAFVTHFVELEKAGYELTSGGGDMLIFQKKSIQTPADVKSEDPKIVTKASKTLQNTIAVEEASAQPEISETIAQPKGNMSKEAATVLDDIPVEIPPPGPAAPTAPSTERPRKSLKPGPKVRRQEEVFSGTRPLRSTQKPLQEKSDNSYSKSGNSKNENRSNERQDGPSFYKRTTRTIKRGVLGAAAFGATAYAIGVVAEGIGAQAQVEGDTYTGPRTKVVMPTGQRPGIYSTESSRQD